MAFVAETMGARQIELPDMAGELTKGVTDAAAIAAARAKQEQVKMALDNAKLQQEQMKVGVTLDYLNKMATATNPTVRKVLTKGFQNQYKQMYGQDANPDTITGVINTPDIQKVLTQLQNIYTDAPEQAEISALSELLKNGLAGPFIELESRVGEFGKRMSEREKAELSAAAASARAAGTQTRFETAELNKKEKEIRDQISKTTDPLSAGYQQLLNAKESLDRNDLQGVWSVLSILAKNVGADAGALSNQDLQNYMPKTFGTDAAKVQAYIDGPKEAKIDPRDVEGLKKLVAMAAKNISARYADRLSLARQNFEASPSYAGVNIAKIFNPSETYIKNLQKFGGFGQKPGALMTKISPAKMIKAGFSREEIIKRIPQIEKQLTVEVYNKARQDMGVK